jgi:hypothetical protein
MTDQQQAEAPAGAPADSGPIPVRGEVITAYESMLAAVPDAESGGGMERILEQIAAATDLSQLDAPWRTGDFEQLAGQVVVIQTIAKMPSEYASGLPWFLVVDLTIEQTGELVKATTGAVSIVAQLVKAWQLGSLPARARVMVAEKPTRSGYYPQHLEFLPKSGSASNGAGHHV